MRSGQAVRFRACLNSERSNRTHLTRNKDPWYAHGRGDGRGEGASVELLNILRQGTLKKVRGRR